MDCYFSEQIEKRRAEVNEELAEIMTGFEASIQNLQTHDVVDNFSNGPGRMPDKHDRNWNKSIDNDDDNRSNDKSDDDDEEDDDSEDDDEDEEMLPTSKSMRLPWIFVLLKNFFYIFHSYD